MSTEFRPRPPENLAKKSLVATNLHKAFGEKVILDQESLSINPADRIGLVGLNGCGKSTLIKILTGKERPDNGHVSNQGLRIGYLAQDFLPEGSKTLYEVAIEDVKEVAAALEEFDRMNSDFKADDPDFVRRYSELTEILIHSDGYDLREKVRAVLDDLDIKRPFSTKVSTLSGGEILRLALARILIAAPDILLLDEPTNHLDLQGNLLLRTFLHNRQGGYLIVSHDRDLLDEVTTSTLELEKGKIRVCGGNYSFYREQKEIETAAKEREVVRLLKERDRIERLKEKEKERAAHSARRGSKPRDHDTFQAGFFKNRAGATAGKRASEFDRRLTEVSQRLESTQEKRARIIKPAFKEGGSYKGKALITAKDLACGYEGKDIVKGVNLEVYFGDRIALFGNNGAGKTTLVKGLLGSESVSINGQVWRTKNFSVRVLDQNYSLVDRNKTVLENIRSVTEDTPITEIRKHLARFLFMETADVNKKAGLLSGGEIARLAIAMVVAMPIDVLVLDEPTNNLDIASINEIEKALKEFEGGIFIISHDLSFLKGVGVDKSYLIISGNFRSLSTNPSDGEVFKKELLAYLQGTSS